MPLDDFEKWLLGEVSNFAQSWRDEHKEDPDEFPGIMSRDQWWAELKAAMPFPQPPL